MKLSTRSEYACLALIDLARHRDEGYLITAAIAERQEVPKQYLEQILLILKRAGYVRSRRGTGGGYRLARDPAAISLAEVIRLLDGALAPVESVSRYFYEPPPSAAARRCSSIPGDPRLRLRQAGEHHPSPTSPGNRQRSGGVSETRRRGSLRSSPQEEVDRAAGPGRRRFVSQARRVWSGGAPPSPRSPRLAQPSPLRGGERGSSPHSLRSLGTLLLS